MNNGTFITNNQPKEKITDRPSKSIETVSAEQSKSLFFLLTFAARYFAFYGMQYLICTKLNISSFSMLESLVIYLGVISIFARPIK